ncbi:DUF3575 domain-containing protein [Alistipes sp. OttesenSCG-928-L06]|nr:DUF3575 domain-containing protein [Alistipes sp. OttesenSCG-928-L06]
MLKIKQKTKFRHLLGLAVCVICLATCFQSAYAQSGQVIMSLCETTIKQAIDDLQKQTVYKVEVNWEYLDPNRRIFFPSHELEVPELLRGSLAGTGFTWIVLGDQIIITQAKPSNVDIYGPKVYYFNIDKAILMRDFSTNRAMLESLDILLSDPQITEHIDSVLITAAASPIASRSYNERLSISRAKALEQYILKEHPAIPSGKIFSSPVGIDWDGFWAIVESSPGLPFQAEVLALKDSGAEALMLQRLRTVGGNVTHRYLIDVIYPRLQYASVQVVLDDGRRIPAKGSPIKQLVTPRVVCDTVWIETVVRDTVVIRDCPPVVQIVDASEQEPQQKKPFYIAVKNNLLYDLGLLPNLALEIPFGQNHAWSLEAQANWSWWKTGDPDYWFHRVQIAGVEVRRWLGNREAKNSLNGWYVGAYGYGGTYDIRLFTNKNSDLGQLSNLTWSAGLSLGYATPIARRWNLEFNLSAGYLSGRYYNYYRSDCEPVFPKQSIHDRQYFGLTKAGVSLVWQIGSGVNENYKKKGGKR